MEKFAFTDIKGVKDNRTLLISTAEKSVHG